MNTNEKKLDTIKKSLLELYRQLPDQFALENVKSSFKKTISAINEVQNKRHKRNVQQYQNEMQNKMQFNSLESAQKALHLLDKMLQDEEKKLETPKTEPQQGTNSILND